MTKAIVRSDRSKRTGGDLSRLSATPEARFLGSAVGLAASLIGIYQFFGLEAFALGTAAGLAYYVRYAYKRLRSVHTAEQRLLNELPSQHAFLVEFLRQTYGFPDDKRIPEANETLAIHVYRNNFVVRGTDCENSQKIDGSNVGEAPVRALSFAVVGGSSASADALGARYSIDGAGERRPEFPQDEDRSKVVVCTFPTPLQSRGQFSLSYHDLWPGSMRLDADGFFFPEALYFPAGIHRLSSQVSFSFPLATIAVLEVDLRSSEVRECGSQPEPANPEPGQECAYEWSIDDPDPACVYVMYYRSES